MPRIARTRLLETHGQLADRASVRPAWPARRWRRRASASIVAADPALRQRADDDDRHRPVCHQLRRKLMPSMRGISMSSVSTSGSRRRIMSRATNGSPAPPTTSMSGSPFSASLKQLPHDGRVVDDQHFDRTRAHVSPSTASSSIQTGCPLSSPDGARDRARRRQRLDRRMRQREQLTAARRRSASGRTPCWRTRRRDRPPPGSATAISPARPMNAAVSSCASARGIVHVQRAGKAAIEGHARAEQRGRSTGRHRDRPAPDRPSRRSSLRRPPSTRDRARLAISLQVRWQVR